MEPVTVGMPRTSFPILLANLTLHGGLACQRFLASTARATFTDDAGRSFTYQVGATRLGSCERSGCVSQHPIVTELLVYLAHFFSAAGANSTDAGRALVQVYLPEYPGLCLPANGTIECTVTATAPLDSFVCRPLGWQTKPAPQ